MTPPAGGGRGCLAGSALTQAGLDASRACCFHGDGTGRLGARVTGPRASQHFTPWLCLPSHQRVPGLPMWQMCFLTIQCIGESCPSAVSLHAEEREANSHRDKSQWAGEGAPSLRLCPMVTARLQPSGRFEEQMKGKLKRPGSGVGEAGLGPGRWAEPAPAASASVSWPCPPRFLQLLCCAPQAERLHLSVPLLSPLKLGEDGRRQVYSLYEQCSNEVT